MKKIDKERLESLRQAYYEIYEELLGNPEDEEVVYMTLEEFEEFERAQDAYFKARDIFNSIPVEDPEELPF